MKSITSHKTTKLHIKKGDKVTVISGSYKGSTGEVKEVIIAVNANVEGQTTAHYITDQLEPFEVAISRLAHGVPVGGELDYLDEGTLSAAMRARTKF